MMWQTKMNSLSIFTLFAAFSCVSALYFHIQETEKKCFIEEIPEQTMVTGNLTVLHRH